MAKTISFNGQQYQFPDDASDEEISSSLEEHHAPSAMDQKKQDLNELPFLARLGLSLAKSGTRPINEVFPERMAALGRGGTEIGQGAKQAYLLGKEKLGYGNPGEAEKYTSDVMNESNVWNDSPQAKDPYNQLITAIPSALLMGGPAGAEAKLLTKILASGATGGIAGGSKFAPNANDRIGNIVEGSAISAAIPIIPKVPSLIGKAINEARPTNLLARFIKSPLSEKELARNLEVAKGTQTGLGDIVGSPTAKRLQENIITKIPFTGGNAALKQTGKVILDRGENIVNRYLGEAHPLEVSDTLGEILVNAKKEGTALKDSLYRQANEEAEKSGFNLKLPNFTNLAAKHIDDIESSNVLQFEPEARNLLKKLNIYKGAVKQERNVGKLVDEQGKPILDEVVTTSPSLKEANILAGKLSEMSDRYGSSISIADRNASNVLGSLARTLKNDIRKEIGDSGNQLLKEHFSTAERNYEKNYSNFLEKDLNKFTHGKKSPDELVAKFLQTSNTSDKADQLEKLLKVVPKKNHDLIKYSYFSRAFEGAEDMKVVNPNKLKTLWNK